MGDVFRIMPLIPMLIIPFAELLIPVYMKLGLMPTTFESKKDKVSFSFPFKGADDSFKIIYVNGSFPVHVFIIALKGHYNTVAGRHKIKPLKE